MSCLFSAVLLLFIGFLGQAQYSWDYAWNYTTTMQYYSNKAAIKKALKQTQENAGKKEKYVMYPHWGKSTYDSSEEKLSDFKLQQIAIEALKGIDWMKQGVKDQWEAYRMRDKAINELMNQYKAAFQFHNDWLQRKNYPTNDLAFTWALGLALSKKILDTTVSVDNQVKNLVSNCRAHLMENKYVDKNNYEKSMDQIRLVSWGIRPYLQYLQAQKNNNANAKKQAEDIAKLFLQEYNPEIAASK